MKLYHLTLCTGHEPTTIIPQVPKSRMIGEDSTTQRICVAPTLDNCLTSIDITNIVIDKMLTLIHENEKVVINEPKRLILPFIVRTYNISKKDPELRMFPKLAYNAVPDSIITHECWLTEYRQPVRTEKMWLINADIDFCKFQCKDGNIYKN